MPNGSVGFCFSQLERRLLAANPAVLRVNLGRGSCRRLLAGPRKRPRPRRRCPESPRLRAPHTPRRQREYRAQPSREGPLAWPAHRQSDGGARRSRVLIGGTGRRSRGGAGRRRRGMGKSAVGQGCQRWRPPSGRTGREGSRRPWPFFRCPWATPPPAAASAAPARPAGCRESPARKAAERRALPGPRGRPGRGERLQRSPLGGGRTAAAEPCPGPPAAGPGGGGGGERCVRGRAPVKVPPCGETRCPRGAGVQPGGVTAPLCLLLERA